MKKVFIAIFMFLPMMMSAQNVLTPQQQLEQAQKQLEEAKKAVEAAKVAAENAKKQAEEAAKKAAAEKAAAEKAAAEKAAAEKAKIEQQIEAAKAEAARLNAEAEKLKKQAETLEKNAQQQASDDLEPSISHEPVTLPAIGGQPVVVDTPEQKADEKKTTEQKPVSTANGWVVPTAPTTNKKAEKEAAPKLANGVALKKDPKYLEGAITLNDEGKVEFVLNTDANGKSAAQIYDIVYNYLSGLTQGSNNISSRVALVNPNEHIIANTMDEWLVFNSSFISLDRSEFKYQLVAKIANNSLTLTMGRMYYNYEEGRSTGFKSSAEETITDKVALTKKKNDLAKIFGKFRRCTIDRKDQIFSEITDLVKK